MKMRPISRVMLIYPPVTFAPQSMKQCHLPLGLAYLAAYIRKEVDLCVLDAAAEGWSHEEPAGEKYLRYGLPMAEIERRIAEFKPDLVGMSCIFSSQFRNVVEVAAAAKRVDPEILTITGGTHVTFLPEYCMKRSSDLDFIARGEGEATLLDLIHASREGRGPETVAGLVFRRGTETVINPPRPLIADINSIPFPARDLFPVETYSRVGMPMGTVYKNRPYMNLITSRGCAHRCTFCSSTNFWGNRYRMRSPESVLEEMEYLYRDLGIREFKFFDDNLTSDRARAKAIFRGMIDRGIKVSWNTPNGIHVVALDEEMLDLMKASGAYELTLAVESGDEEVLKKIIHKPTRLDQLEKAAKMIRARGIGTYAFFIIGFPGETKEQIHRTLDFSLRLDPDRMSLFIYNPLPGTPLFEECVAKGYVSPDEMAEDADYFEGRFDTPEWTRDELHRLRRNWFWRYHFGLIGRHPVRFLNSYGSLVVRPRQTLEVLKRLVRN